MKDNIHNNKLNMSIENFPDTGFANLGTILDKKKCKELRDLINIDRPINPDIFYENEDKFNKNGRWHKYAPGLGHNFIENMDLSFIENNEQFINYIIKVLGKNYTILKKSVIRSVSSHYIPDWLQEYLKDVGRPNLNPFIKDQFQDIQYFYFTDYHQDKTRPQSNFVTFYVYLDDVNREYSALRILEGSHKAGMDTYPHNLRRSKENKNIWFYTDRFGNTLKCKEKNIVGKTGLISCFHGLTLHGTPINNSKDPRISLRYLIAPEDGNSENTFFNQANELIYGPQNIDVHRYDVKKDGSYMPIGSALDSQE